MTPVELNGYILLVQTAIALGIKLKDGIAGFIKSIRPEVTDEELNAIIHGVKADAKRRAQVSRDIIDELGGDDGEETPAEPPIPSPI